MPILRANSHPPFTFTTSPNPFPFSIRTATCPLSLL
jgi:hypothetical protein